MRGKNLTDKEKSFIRDNINAMTDAEIAEALDVTKSCVINFKWREKIYRSKERLSEIARRNNLNKKTPPHPNSLKNLLSINKRGLTEDERRRRVETFRKTIAETIAAEKRRVMFGLPQKTRIRLSSPERKRRLTMYWRLRRNGYKYLGYSRFLVPAERHLKQEKYATENYKIIFVEDDNTSEDRQGC